LSDCAGNALLVITTAILESKIRVYKTSKPNDRTTSFVLVLYLNGDINRNKKIGIENT
jgi:hypothetical protein